jgi:hypothetical protein
MTYHATETHAAISAGGPDSGVGMQVINRILGIPLQRETVGAFRRG